MSGSVTENKVVLSGQPYSSSILFNVHVQALNTGAWIRILKLCVRILDVFL